MSDTEMETIQNSFSKMEQSSLIVKNIGFGSVYSSGK